MYIIPDKIINRFKIESELVSTLDDAMGDIFVGPLHAIGSLILQTLEDSEMEITITNRSFLILSEVRAVQQTIDGFLEQLQSDTSVARSSCENEGLEQTVKRIVHRRYDLSE